MNARSLRLSHRLALAFSLVVLATTGSVFVAMDGYFRSTLLRNVERRATNLGRALAAVSRPHLLHYDYLTLQQVADGVVDGEEVLYAIVLDKEGKVAGYSGAREKLGSELGDESNSFALAATEPGLREWDRLPDGREEQVVEAIHPVRLPDDPLRWGTIRLGLSLSTVNRQLAVTRMLLFLCGIGGVILTGFVSLLLARRITRPLARLVEATHRLEAGSWDPSFRVDSGDEIGELARKFSSAAASLDERNRDLVRAKEELTALNGTLEDKVEDRTAELHASRETYRLLVEGSPDAFCLVDDDRLLFVNAAFVDIFGYEEPETQAPGFSWTTIIHPNFHEIVRRAFVGLHEGALTMEEEWVGLGRSGRTIDLEARARVVPHEGRPVIELVLVDTTQKKKVIQQIVQNERMRAMGEMTAMVAHHFNNILAVIHGRAQLVQRRVTDPRLCDSLEIIQSSVLKAGEMVRHLQDYFGEQVDLRFVEVDVNALLEEVAVYQERVWRTTRPREAPPVHVKLDLVPLPPVRGAGPLLHDAFGRVLVNAAEAMPHGGEIHVRSRSNGNLVTVTIQDQGEGMDPGTLERAFDPFFTTKGSNSRGLGLPASLGILQRHEGRISIESRPGAGTEVRIVLPVEARVSRIVPFTRSAEGLEPTTASQDS